MVTLNSNLVRQIGQRTEKNKYVNTPNAAVIPSGATQRLATSEAGGTGKPANCSRLYLTKSAE